MRLQLAALKVEFAIIEVENLAIYQIANLANRTQINQKASRTEELLEEEIEKQEAEEEEEEEEEEKDKEEEEGPLEAEEGGGDKKSSIYLLPIKF